MPEKFGRYKVEVELGRGAMANVYKAYDPETNRYVAIKVLKQLHNEDIEYRQRFLQEARAAGNVSTHKNIATIYDVGEEDGFPFIAMEYAGCENLEEKINKKGQPSVIQVLKIGIQLADALEYAHQHSVVHRDVKPSNIMCVDDSDEIRITDFGIARVQSEHRTAYTQLGMVVGTVHYMSPEQIEGSSEHPIDGRSDIFSAGVVLYELLTGLKPFDGDTFMGVADKVRRQRPRSLKELAGDIPHNLINIIEKCLEKDSKHRYQSATELSDALSRVLHDLEEDVRNPEPSIVSFRVRWTSLMAMLVSLVMLASIYVIYQRQHHSMTQLVLDYGASLASFIADQSAEPILLDDFVLLDTFINQVEQKKEFNHIVITDHKGLVKGSTRRHLIGQQYSLPREAIQKDEIESIKVYERFDETGQRVFNLAATVRFADKHVGNVFIDLSQTSLTSVLNLTVWMLVLLMGVTVSAAVIIAFGMARAIDLPIRKLKQGMNELPDSNLRYRIAEQRSDEFGSLFYAFDHMAETLQSRFSPGLDPEQTQRNEAEYQNEKTESVLSVLDNAVLDDESPECNVVKSSYEGQVTDETVIKVPVNLCDQDSKKEKQEKKEEMGLS